MEKMREAMAIEEVRTRPYVKFDCITQLHSLSLVLLVFKSNYMHYCLFPSLLLRWKERNGNSD